MTLSLYQKLWEEPKTCSKTVILDNKLKLIYGTTEGNIKMNAKIDAQTEFKKLSKTQRNTSVYRGRPKTDKLCLVNLPYNRQISYVEYQLIGLRRLKTERDGNVLKRHIFNKWTGGKNKFL